MNKSVYLFTGFAFMFGAPAFGAMTQGQCDALHVQITSQLITTVNGVHDAQLQNIMMNGSNSGVNIFFLSEADKTRMSNAAKATTPKFKSILAKAKCTSSIPGVESIKTALQTENFQGALLGLYGMKGLRGVSAQLIQVAGTNKVPTAGAEIQVAAATNAEDSDAGGEVVNNAAPVVYRAPTPTPVNKPVPVIKPSMTKAAVPPASPAITPAVAAAPRPHIRPTAAATRPAESCQQVPLGRQFRYDPNKYGRLGNNVRLTRRQWQSVFDRCGSIIGGRYQNVVADSLTCQRCAGTASPNGASGSTNAPERAASATQPRHNTLADFFSRLFHRSTTNK